MTFTPVRHNLLHQLNYTPYCGNSYVKCSWPRTYFNGAQFRCPECGWESKFEPEFIKLYLEKQKEFKRKKSDNLVYSLNEEEFTDYDSVMNDLLNEHEPGEEVEIYEGVAKDYVHNDFIDAYVIIEHIQNRAYDMGGDWAEDYLLDLEDNDYTTLQKSLVRWFNKHAKKPNFANVVDVQKIKVIVEG